MRDRTRKDLHPEARKALQRQLEKDLKTCTLERGEVVTEPPAYWGHEFATLVEKHLGDYVSLVTAWVMLTGHIGSLFTHIKADDRPSGELLTLVSTERAQALVSEIVDLFAALPREYLFYLRIAPSQNAFPDAALSTEALVHHVTADDPLLQVKGRPSVSADSEGGIFAGLFGSKAPFGEHSVLLQIRSYGYVRGSSDDSAAARAISIAKRAVFLGTVLGVFAHKRRFGPFGGVLTSDLWFKHHDAKEQDMMGCGLPHETSEYFGGFHFQGLPESVLLPRALQALSLTMLQNIMNGDDDDADRSPIMAAAEWGFESHASKNQTTAFLQLCIALEAVLGDDADTERLTKSLADRCAYLLGGTRSVREDIRKRFRTLYEHRSKLVHGRSMRLPKAAVESLQWGRSALNQVLRREVQNYLQPS
ncbi:MAG TPA: hypothetical protein VFL36_23345 [Myxococcales bacterium]|nr:hypothetical protein [Myxococcales bacterium]